MDEETRAHKERLLSIYQENLREMEAQRAAFGMQIPLPIINEIKYHRKNIDELRAQLRVGGEEVTFDKILIGIEDLQRSIRDEGARTVKNYNEAFGDQAMLGFGLKVPLYGGILVTAGLAYLYQQYVRDVYLADPYHILTGVIYVVGVLLSIYLTFRLGVSITDSKHEWFIYLMGYDPMEHRKRRKARGRWIG